MISISKPGHTKYAFHSFSEEDYKELAEKYSIAKRYGYRACVTVLTGTGVKDIAFEVAKNQVKKYGRQKLGTFIIGTVGWVTGPIVPLITNSTKILKTAKQIHGGIAYVGECVEDGANICWLPVDIALFGQPIPIGNKGRFNVMGNSTDFLND